MANDPIGSSLTERKARPLVENLRASSNIEDRRTSAKAEDRDGDDEILESNDPIITTMKVNDGR